MCHDPSIERIWKQIEMGAHTGSTIDIARSCGAGAVGWRAFTEHTFTNCDNGLIFLLPVDSQIDSAALDVRKAHVLISRARHARADHV